MSMTAEIHQHNLGLLLSQPLAVLCTRGRRLHASLLAVAPTDDLRRIFFATPRTTEKFANLTADPDAALLVHNATGSADDFNNAMAVTITGRAEEIGPERAAYFDGIYLARHPALADFIAAATTARMVFSVETYRLVRQFQQVTLYRIE
jgi:hypothetical protein